ncbi:MAG: Spy/CpxP family protein refolding chaperone [Terracidiphilus sp.]
MKASLAIRLGVAIGAVLMTGATWAQMPDGGPGRGMGPGPGMDSHRPPFERAFGGHGIEGRWWNNPRIIERLKLTEAQRKEFDGILLQHRETLIDLRANVEKAELEMEPLVRDDQPNETRILAQIDKVAQARAELEKANARYLLALRSKLTPEQWKQVQDFRENRGMQEHGWQGGEKGQGRHMRDGQGWHNGGPPPAAPPGGTPPAPAGGSAPPAGDEQ